MNVEKGIEHPLADAAHLEAFKSQTFPTYRRLTSG
jgi:hypothetical protein